MPQYNPETNQYEESEEERKKREEQSQPGFFDKLGTALQTAGSNFVTNLENAPSNFANNVSNLVQGPVRPSNVATTSPIQNPNIRTIEERVPQQPQPPNYSLATGQNGPGLRYGQAFAPQEQPQQQQQPQPQSPTVPVNPANFQQQQYNASIAQQESGNRPDIGYHDRSKSTAAGTYGLTQAAYQDARRLNPNLPADITQATPEQQTQAMNLYTQQNARTLQRFGVPVNKNTLSTAHLLGATGLNDFMTKKDELGRPYLSPQAQNSNGGYDNLAAIANARLNGQSAPASGGIPQAGQGRGFVNPPMVQPVNPEAGAGRGFVNPQYVQPAAVEQTQPTEPTLTPVQQGINLYQSAQNDPNALIKLGFDENQPEFIRNRAKDRALELYNQDKNLKQAQNELPNLTPKQVADTAQGKNKSSVGDWLQYLLFKHVGLNDLANEKGDQLGIGHQWQSAIGPNGENSLIKTSATGKPIEGYDAITGNQLTSQQLMQAMTNIGGKNKPDVSLQDVESTINGRKIKGRVVTTFNAQNQPVTRVESNGKYYEYTGDWQPVAISTAAAKSETNLVNNLRKTFGNDVLKAESQMIQDAGNFGSATNPMTREQFRALYMAGSSVPTVSASNMPAGTQAQGQVQNVPQLAPQAQNNQPQPAQAQVQQAPVRQAGEPVTAFKERLKDWNQQQDLIRSGQKETLKKASDVIADSANIVTNLTNIERAANDALTKKNNFGTIINGMIPGEQTVGQFFKTQDHINTMNILEQVNKVAAQNAKMLGTNPTDRDLQFVTSTKPDITWGQEAVADWLRKSADAQKRTLDFARKQVQSGGTYIPETPQGAAPGTKENPIKLQ